MQHSTALWLSDTGSNNSRRACENYSWHSCRGVRSHPLPLSSLRHDSGEVKCTRELRASALSLSGRPVSPGTVEHLARITEPPRDGNYSSSRTKLLFNSFLLPPYPHSSGIVRNESLSHFATGMNITESESPGELSTARPVHACCQLFSFCVFCFVMFVCSFFFIMLQRELFGVKRVRVDRVVTRHLSSNNLYCLPSGIIFSR